MAVVVDASAILALADRDDPSHESVAQWMELADEGLVISPLVAARADGMLRRAGGPEAGEALAGDLQSGAYTVRWWADAMMESATIVRTQHASLVDASLIAVAAKARTNRIVSTRHDVWRRLTTVDGSSFEILPTGQSPRPQPLENA